MNVNIETDQLVGVIGPNGAGKSTFIKAVLGFVKPDLGTVKIQGTPAKNARGRVAYVPQRGAVDWDFPITVKEVALMGDSRRSPGMPPHVKKTGRLPCRPLKWFVWKIFHTARSESFPVASSSGFSWPGPWPRAVISFFWMNPLPV